MSAPTLLRLIRSQQGLLYCLGARATWADHKRLRDLEGLAAWAGVDVPEYSPPVPPVVLRAWDTRMEAA